jgi:hypothetical protein
MPFGTRFIAEPLCKITHMMENRIKKTKMNLNLNLNLKANIMKKTILFLTVVISTLLYSQEIPISIIDRANTVNFIFEGVVINSEPYYNNNGSYIYTSNTVEITRILKGDIECGTIEIITEGGHIQDTEHEISHSLTITEGSRGIFLCTETDRPLSTIDFYPETNLQKIEATFEDQSFIRYWWDGEGINAADVWANYDSLALVYNITEAITGLHYVDCGIQKTEEWFQNIETNETIPVKNETPRYPKEDFEAYLAYHKYKRENFMVEGVAATGTVTYDMENFKVTGSSPKFVEFDVTIKDDLGTKYFQAGAVRIVYDGYVFGSGIVANNQVTVTRGSLISNSNCYISPIPQDHTGSSFLVSVIETYLSNCKAQVFTSPQRLMHIKIEVPNCIPFSTVALIDTAVPNIPSIPSIVLFSTGYSNTPSDPNYYEYLNLVHNDVENINYCGAQISGFNPQVVGGGTGDTLIIEGSQFGNLKSASNIYLKNADDGGISEVWLDNLDYIAWTDSLIKVLVPSYDSAIVNGIVQKGLPAGTGNIRIASNDGSNYTSVNPLSIAYSINNHDHKRPYPLTPWSNMNQSFIFRCDTAVANYQNGAMKKIIKKALKDWSCLTGINWTLGPDIAHSSTIPKTDTMCVIQFGILSSNVGAQTHIRSGFCGGAPVHYENDIVINSTKSWFCDTTSASIPLGQIDLYSVILHEFGHAHGLNHVIDIDAIMYYSTASTPGNRKINLEYDASCDYGGNWIIDFTTAPNNFFNSCGLKSITANPNPLCTHIDINEDFANGLNIAVYPNPFTNEISLSIDGLNNEDISLVISDLTGRIVLKEIHSLRDNSVELKISTSYLSAGMYIITLQTHSRGSQSLKIVKDE